MGKGVRKKKEQVEEQRQEVHAVRKIHKHRRSKDLEKWLCIASFGFLPFVHVYGLIQVLLMERLYAEESILD